MRNSLSLTSGIKKIVALVVLSQVAFAQQPDCASAVRLPLEQYSAEAGMDASEAGQDEAAYTWAQCRATHLSEQLRRYPKLQARIAALRSKYGEMRELESDLAGIRAGGGTLYGHVGIRSYAPLEVQLAQLARLARTSAGGVLRPEYARTVQQARRKQQAAIATLRHYRPSPDEDYVHFDVAQWQRMVNRYQQLSRTVMQTLGTRGDAATALGYQILTNWAFDPKGEQ